MGGCAFLFDGNLTISDQQKGKEDRERERGRVLVSGAKGQLAGADESVYV